MAEGRQSSQWFVKDDNGVRGPVSEADLRKILKQSWNPRLEVKQGNSQWHPAASVRKKMDELAASGIYIRFANVAEGPFTITRAHELLKTVSSDGVQVRTGKKGQWVPATQWMDAVRRLERKRRMELQSVAGTNQNETEPLKQSKSGPERVAPTIPAVVAVDDEMIHDAVVVDEDIVEAVLVEPAPPPEAIPVAHALGPGYDPLARTPVHAVPVHEVPVHAVPQPPQPFIQRPAHVPQMRSGASTRSRPRNRNPRNESGAGRVLMKIASFALTICVVIGVVGLKVLKVGGKQALRRQQAEEREQRQRQNLFGPGRPGSGIPRSKSERSEIQYRLPSSPNGSSRTSSSAAAGLPRSNPPVVSSGMLFRPQFVTTDGVVDAGTAFAARIDGRRETLVISALHLFGPAGGLDRDIPAAMLSDRWQGLSLQDCKSGLVHPDVPMQPIPLRLAKPLPDQSAHGDVAVCSVQDFATL